MERPPLDALWIRFLKGKGAVEREKLAEHYLFLVDAETRRLLSRLPPSAYREKREDLGSAGVIGLLQALDHFRPPKGKEKSPGRAFEAYARYRIRGRMLDELRAMDFARRNLRRQARRIREAEEKAQARLGRAPREEEVAAELGWTLEEFYTQVAEINMFRLLSLDAETAAGTTLEGTLADTRGMDPAEAAERRQKISRVRDALGRLPENEQKVLHLYYLEELTFKEIGRVLGVSESRICQIHHMAVFHLQSMVERRSHDRAEGHERVHHPDTGG